MLDAHLKMLEEAKKRDHRKLGKELEPLRYLLDEGPGFPVFPAQGYGSLQNVLDRRIWREIHKKAGYVEVSHSSDHAQPVPCGSTRGHWDHYKDNMYTTVIDDEDLLPSSR